MKDSIPTVSVVIPCYNLGAYLDQSVQSVLDQTYKDFEIIIIDDGSTDIHTQSLFASFNRPKCRIFRTENNGVMEARNLGIRKSKGRYISFLDADDLFEPQFLEKTVELLESDECIAFASCWLRAFGNIEFLWNPDTCDFPHLLAEDTVCTAALTRKNAIVEVGAFDTEMPLPGYEDWDLAINLVKHGFKGRIIPEYLFRYRIRNDSLSCKTIEPKNHDLLMRYIIDKYAEIYKNHYMDILNIIEGRISELEKIVPRAPQFENEYSCEQNVFLKNTINTLMKSRSWKITKPLRISYGLAKSITRKYFTDKNTSNPRCSVIITCFNHDIELQSLIENVKTQLKYSDEIIIVDDGSTNPITLQIPEWYGENQIKIINTTNVGLTQARKVGLSQAKGHMLIALNANQTIEPNLFEKVFKLFDNEKKLSFVICGLYDEKTGFDWIPNSLAISDILACPRLGFPIIRRDSYNTIGGYDSNIDNTYLANLELIIRLVDNDHKGSIIAEALIKSSELQVHRAKDSKQREKIHTLKPLLLKHENILDNFYKEAILGQDYLRQCLQFHLTAKDWNKQDSNKLSHINWGNLRCLEPISAIWGFDRGQPIDRYYIGMFLDKHRHYISGRVLEVKEPVYMQTYGQDIEEMDIVDIDKDNPLATITCDLSAKDSLPDNTYDCFIITQTIHFIYDIKEVIKNTFRTLRPGGVALATLPCLSRVDYESGINGDYWRFTIASVRKLFEEAFGPGQVEIQAYGNVMTSCAFLMGIAAEELSSEELNYHDQYFPLLICVKAVKSQNKTTHSSVNRSPQKEKALVLLYHRVDNSEKDRWNLCVSPENFSEHVRYLSLNYKPTPLSDIATQIRAGKLIHGSAAITFDDGYRDNLTKALPILEEHGFPATFFISGEGATYKNTFWWEMLDGSVREINLDDDNIIDLHRRLMVANIDERELILSNLKAPSNTLPARLSMTDLKQLSQAPLAEIGAHGWSHRALSKIPGEEQRKEVIESIKMIKHFTGKDVNSFAYPFGGYYTHETKDFLRDANICLACTIGNEPITSDSDLLALPRLEVGDWTIEEFKLKTRSYFNE